MRASPGPVRVVAAVAGALVGGSLPLFLLSALSPLVSDELGFGAGELGVAVAAFFLAAAAASVPGGALADRVGAGAALRLGLGVAALAGAAIAVVADDVVVLTVLLLAAGSSLGLIDTGGARAIAAVVPLGRQGLAFAGKEASIPTASLLAGIAVPVFGAAVGWRPAFAAGAVAALVLAALVPRGIERPWWQRGVDDQRSGDRRGQPARGNGRLAGPLLLALTAAAGGGAAAASVTFLVPAAVSAGRTPGAAGLLLAVGSAGGILTRLAAGVAADRWIGRELSLVGALLTAGAVGAMLLAHGPAGVVVPAALLAIGAGWGWTGLVFLAAVRLVPDRPARAAGIVLSGLGVGGAAGPAGFGRLAAGPGYPAAWSSAAVAMAIGAAAALTASWLRARHRAPAAGVGGEGLEPPTSSV